MSGGWQPQPGYPYPYQGAQGWSLGAKIAAAMTVGAGVGLVLVMLVVSATGDDDGESSADERSEPGAVASTDGSGDLADAVASCAPGSEHAQVLDDGDGLALQGRTDPVINDGLEAVEIACILTALDTPETVVSRMDRTRALDGTQTGEWGDLSASWTYHPDRGLDVIVEQR